MRLCLQQKWTMIPVDGATFKMRKVSLFIHQDLLSPFFHILFLIWSITALCFSNSIMKMLILWNSKLVKIILRIPLNARNSFWSKFKRHFLRMLSLKGPSRRSKYLCEYTKRVASQKCFVNMNYRTRPIITHFLKANFNIQGVCFFRFCPYVGLVFKSGLYMHY